MNTMEVNTSSEWTVSHKTTEPFIFRSGGFFGVGRKAWSIRAAVRHMDRYPNDGIYHLEDGTLAEWLQDQNADDLAELAREVVRERGIDPRAELETFLIGTGLVRRPRLVLKPRQLGILYILVGQASERQLRIRKGRGRGYLFGNLHSNDHWLRIEPAQFGGKATETLVNVNTASLPISDKPHEAEIAVESSASADPIMVPVRFKVVGMPSPLERWITRPAIGLGLAGIFGATLGTLLGLSGMAIPGWLPGLSELSPALAWALVVGVFWGILGGIRGLVQPLAWPVLYANRRCLIRLLIWLASISLIGLVLLWAWGQIPGLGKTPFGASPATLLLLALCFAILPASLGEIWNARSTRGVILIPTQQPLIRPGFLILTVVLFSLFAIGAVRIAAPVVEQIDIEEATGTAQTWLETRWQQLDHQINAWIDDASIRYYDQRAPSRTPTPAAGESGETGTSQDSS